MDGGSDWVCLYRDFARYIISETDELLLGLRAFYKYTLLPAEVRDAGGGGGGGGCLSCPASWLTGPVGCFVLGYLVVCCLGGLRSVCVCAGVQVCMHACVSVCVRACMHVCVCEIMCECVYMCVMYMCN